MMTKSHAAILLAVLQTGCLFGKKEDPTNNVVTVNNTTPDMGGADAGGTYGTLEANETACGSPFTLWFAPNSSMTAQLNEGSVVATTAPPMEGLSQMLIGDVTVAHASSIGGKVWVFAAAGVPDGSGQLTPVLFAEQSINVDAEVWQVYVESRWINRTVAMPVANIINVTVVTSAGAYDCSMTVDREEVTEMNCAVSPVGDIVATKIDSPARVDFAPVLGTFGESYTYRLLVPDLVATVSGPTADGEQIGVVRATGESAAFIDLSNAIETEHASPHVFAERSAFGVEASNFGFPLLMTLARRRGADRVEPLILGAAGFTGDQYELDETREPWSLSRRLEPTRTSFTFVDGYDVKMTLEPVRFRYVFAPGQLSLGYVGLVAEGNGLIFSRPGGFLGMDFLEFELPNAVELAAYKNIPLEDSTGRPAIVVIHGENRDRVAIFDWDFGIDAQYVEDVLADGFTDAKGLNGGWFFSDAGTIPLLATYEGRKVTAIINIPNLSDLSSACR